MEADYRTSLCILRFGDETKNGYFKQFNKCACSETPAVLCFHIDVFPRMPRFGRRDRADFETVTSNELGVRPVEADEDSDYCKNRSISHTLLDVATALNVCGNNAAVLRTIKRRAWSRYVKTHSLAAEGAHQE
jgi:hypothetical protein